SFASPRVLRSGSRRIAPCTQTPRFRSTPRQPIEREPCRASCAGGTDESARVSPDLPRIPVERFEPVGRPSTATRATSAGQACSLRGGSRPGRTALRSRSSAAAGILAGLALLASPRAPALACQESSEPLRSSEPLLTGFAHPPDDARLRMYWRV